MSEPKKHFFKMPPNIKNLTDEELNQFADQIWLEMTKALKKDKEEKE